MKITKRQLRQIIREERELLAEMMDDLPPDRYGGDQNYSEFRKTRERLIRLINNMTRQGRAAVAGELIGMLERYGENY